MLNPRTNSTKFSDLHQWLFLFLFYFIFTQVTPNKKSQKEVAEVVGVADVTIRHSYRLMYPHAKKLFPENFQFVTSIQELPSI